MNSLRGPAIPGVSRRRRARFPFLGVVAALVVIAVQSTGFIAITWTMLHAQRVVDQIAVWNYTPSDTIRSYVDRSGMTELGEFLFYATRPVIEGPEEFAAACASDHEDFGMLGCYLPDTDSIHLYDITDERLDGMEEVIATHEMLHAAWDRMSEEELASVSPLLEEEFASLAADTGLAARMEFYARTEPGQRLNELHSIIGTEITDLDPVLERHYGALISDRENVVALHVTSNQVFVDLENQTNALVTQLESLRVDIDADYTAYGDGYDRLEADVSGFNARADDGEFTSQSRFDRERAALLARQDALDALYADITARNGQYEALLAQLEVLNSDAAELNRSVNISPRSGDAL